jgi:hypothetical protein
MLSCQYTEYNKALSNVKALFDNNNLIKIIKYCDLSPDQNCWRVWRDNCGYKLTIGKDKRIIIKNDFESGKNKIVKDIFFNSSPEKISEISERAYISFAKSFLVEDGILENICFMFMFGYDKRLRFLSLIKDEWIKEVSPLAVGIKYLTKIVSVIDMEDNESIINNIFYLNGVYQAQITKSWLSNWKPSKKIQLDLLLTNKTLANKLLKDMRII